MPTAPSSPITVQRAPLRPIIARDPPLEMRATAGDCDTGANSVTTISRALAARLRPTGCQDDTWRARMARSIDGRRDDNGVPLGLLLLACVALALGPNHPGAPPAPPGFRVEDFGSTSPPGARDLNRQ